MKASEARQRIEKLISLFSELYDLVHEEPEPPNLSQRCRELTAEAAREVGFLDLILDRWTKRMMPWGQDARPTDMFRESLAIDSALGSGILMHAIAELRIALAKIEKAVNGDWSRELDET
jgi:hypothetical protein